jgi:hypothetical protein
MVYYELLLVHILLPPRRGRMKERGIFQVNPCPLSNQEEKDEVSLKMPQ